MTLLEQALERFSNRLTTVTEKITETPSQWIEKYFYVPDSRDPKTDEKLGKGPLRLASHQKHIIDEALSKNPDGTFKYSTVIYSAPKKSGKSALASAVTLYFAYHNSDGDVYCLANDKTQSTDRIYLPIRKCFRIHRELGGIFSDINPSLTEVTLPNNTKIRAIPCDAAGEAGSQPLLSTWSELWAFETENKRRLWTEMTIPPTLEGYAMRWVESYAGFTGKSELLEQLYNMAVKQGEPHPDFDYLINEGKPAVFVNEAAGIFCYWDEVPRMVWQSQRYYAQQSLTLQPSEFLRIHRNQWVSPVDSFIQPETWNSCKKDLGLIRDKKTPVILGVDGAISNDYAAIVGVTRDPDDNDSVAVRFCYIFTPQKSGGTIKISETVEPKIRELCKQYNVLCVAYDKYQLEDMAQRLRKDGIVWMYSFNQQGDRAVADKGLYDRVINHRIYWDANGDGLDKNGDLPSLFQHITQAGTKTDNGKMRLEKLTDSAKIDAAVALSMATEKCMNLNIDNRESKVNLAEKLRRGTLTDDDINRLVEGNYARK
jgi:phage terminase large subunit-like protein